MILATNVEMRDELNQNYYMKLQEAMLGTALKRLGLPE